MTPPSSDAPTITFLTSNKKKRLLTIGGYTYQQNKTAEKVAYWIYEEKDCWAGVHLDANDQFIKYKKVTHTHLPMPERVEIRKMITVVKREWRVKQQRLVRSVMKSLPEQISQTVFLQRLEQRKKLVSVHRTA